MHHNSLKSFLVKELSGGRELHVAYDLEGTNPRHWDSGLTRIVGWNRDNVIGDDTDRPDSPEDFIYSLYQDAFPTMQNMDDDEAEGFIRHSERYPGILLGLFMYGVNMLRFDTEPIDDTLDFRPHQVGFVCVPQATMEHEGLTSEQWDSIIDSEVRAWQNYANGYVFAAFVIDRKTCSLGQEHENIDDSLADIHLYNGEGPKMRVELEELLSYHFDLEGAGSWHYA